MKLIIELLAIECGEREQHIEALTRVVDWPAVPQIGETLAPFLTSDNDFPVWKVEHQMRRNCISIICKVPLSELELYTNESDEFEKENSPWIISRSGIENNYSERLAIALAKT